MTAHARQERAGVGRVEVRLEGQRVLVGAAVAGRLAAPVAGERDVDVRGQSLGGGAGQVGLAAAGDGGDRVGEQEPEREVRVALGRRRERDRLDRGLGQPVPSISPRRPGVSSTTPT
ncbi:hypothetical protein ACQP00_29330 [Dactylosporangium sp. CS-047395]|uniref:hypothetical protein n=1 Tax=Dactylosporangium sp. CS-047395 TaxID=3239936 RepID=UPI003D90DBCC